MECGCGGLVVERRVGVVGEKEIDKGKWGNGMGQWYVSKGGEIGERGRER